MIRTTIKGLIDEYGNGGALPEGTSAWMHVSRSGWVRVSHVRWPYSNDWAVCPDLNGGLGQSFCVHHGMTILIAKDRPGEEVV